MSDTLTVTLTPAPTNPEVSVLTFGEVIDASIIGELNEILSGLLAENRVKVVGDFTQTKQLDGSVVGVLMGFKGQLQNFKGGNLLIAGVSPDLEKVLHMMGAHKIFDIFPAVFNAVKEFEEVFRVEVVQVSFPSSLDYVPGVRDFLSNIALMRGFNEKEAYRIQTIVDEICNNAIEHGSKGSEAIISIRCTVDNDKLDLVVEDKGADSESAEGLKKAVAKVQFTEHGKVSVEKRGRGLPIVAMLADMLEIDTRSGPGTKIHVVKFKKQENEYFSL